jgi:hypothetical protein
MKKLKLMFTTNKKIKNLKKNESRLLNMYDIYNKNNNEKNNNQ